MAAYIRALVSGHRTDDPAKDKVTNTLYFKHNGFPDVDWNALANDLLAIAQNHAIWMNGQTEINVRLYSMEEAEPREPKADVTGARADIDATSLGPRQIALCLSFRGASDRPRSRGRIYVGGFGKTVMGPRPGDAQRTLVHSLADSFAGLGGVDVDWCVYSPTTYAVGQNYGDAFKPVALSWVDDRWDVQRSRALEPTSRVTKTHSED